MTLYLTGFNANAMVSHDISMLTLVPNANYYTSQAFRVLSKRIQVHINIYFFNVLRLCDKP